MTLSEHDEQRSSTTCQRCGHSASDHDMGMLCMVVHCGCRAFARARREKQLPEKKSEKKLAPPATLRVLPMELEIGDRLADETGEWQVADTPYTTNAGKTAHVRVKRVDQSDVTVLRSWGAHERIAVRRG